MSAPANPEPTSVRERLSAQSLKDALDYDPHSGLFRWTSDRRRTRKGDIAGCLDPAGYRSISLDGVAYKAHRLAVLYMTGVMPPDGMPVDHVNRLRDDNSWANLRVVTHKENAQNQSRPAHTNPRSQSAATDRGLRLIARGVHLRTAAARVGVAASTLVRARKRANLEPLPKGRPTKEKTCTPN